MLKQKTKSKITTATPTQERLFSTFFMGGFECTYAHVDHKRRLDLLASTKHDTQCRADYQRLKGVGIKTVREGLAWSQIDKGNNKYDFSRFEPMMQIAAEEGIQQIWDLNHFDYPEYVDPFSPAFAKQFAKYSVKAIKLIRKYQKGTIYIVPMNEISFWSHMGGMIGVWNPYQITKGYIFKKQLAGAAIAAMDAIWAVDSDVRFIHVDPVFERRAKEPTTIVTRAIEEAWREIKFQALDMICGRLEPQLGGHPKYLDLIGANYYPYNQEWITGDDWMDESCHLLIPYRSKFRISLADILEEAYKRYNRPIVLTEVGAWGSLREPWWRRTLAEIEEAMDRGVVVEGVCAYPVIDRHDWEDDHITHSGLWDFPDEGMSTKRMPYEPIMGILRPYMKKWQKYNKVSGVATQKVPE